MSNVEGGFGRSLFGGLIRDPGERVPEDRPAHRIEEQMPPEDRRLYIFGAMGAAFAIGMVFLIAAFIVILIMVLVW